MRTIFFKNLRPFIFLSLAIALYFLGKPAFGIALSAGTSGGLMQQPSSSYYLAIYGGFFEVSNEPRTLMARGVYLERPKFTSLGFTDQENAIFALIGTKLTKAKNHGLLAYFGYGRVYGYIRQNATDSEPSVKRSYLVYGPTAAISYELRLANFTASLGHQTVVGFTKDNAQTQAMVAWPYNFLTLDLGMVW